MFTKKCLSVLMFCLLVTLVTQAQTSSTELNLTLGEQRVRFAPTRSFQEMRLEVVNSVGEIIFSHTTTEAEFDWNLRTGNSEALTPGLYRYALTLKLGEDQTRQHTGHFIVEKGQDQIWLTASNGTEVSGTALNASRSGGRSVAGLGNSANQPVKRDVSGRGIVDENGNKLSESEEDKKATKQEKAALLGTVNMVPKYDVGGVNLIDSAMIETSGNVGIGTTAPNAKLSVSANTAAPPSAPGIIGYFANVNESNTLLAADSYGNGPWHSDFLFRRARGTMAAPAALLADDIIGQVQARGYGATGFTTTSRAGIRMTAAENWNDTAQGAFLSFLTTPNGSNAINTERMRITSTGNVGIGTATPADRLNVVGGGILVSFDGTSRLLMNSEPGGANIGTTTNTDLTILSNSSPAIFIKASTKNVGIGTSNAAPVDKLEVKGVGTAISATDETVRTRFFSSAAYPGGFIGTSSQHDFFIRSGDNTRITVKADGKVGFGTESPASRLHVFDGVGQQGHIQVGGVSSGSDEKIIIFGDSNCGGLPCVSIGERSVDDQMELRAATFLFEGNGASNTGHLIPNSDDVQNVGSATNRWRNIHASNPLIQTSDARLKKNVTNLRYGLRDLMQLRPVSFEWKSKSDERTHLGFVAQETEQVIPEAVYRDKNPDAPLGMMYSDLVPVIIKSIQEQQTALTQKDQAIHLLRVQNAALLKRLETVERALVRKARKPRGR